MQRGSFSCVLVDYDRRRIVPSWGAMLSRFTSGYMVGKFRSCNLSSGFVTVATSVSTIGRLWVFSELLAWRKWAY